MEKQEKMFQELEKRFTKKLILAVSKLNKKMRIKVDTLNYTTDRVLFMEYKDERWRLVTFLSKSLNKIEKNYEIHNKKILAVIRELEN